MNQAPWKSLVPAIMLCFVGAAGCGMLMSQSTELVTMGCGVGQSDCDSVLTSRWSVFPPLADSQSNATSSFHIPVTVLGFGYFAFLGAWLLFIGQPSAGQRRIHLVPLVVAGIGTLASLGFIGVMASTGQWCQLCLGMHLVNFAVLFSVFSLSPASEAEVDYSAEQHPSPRLVCSVAALGITLAWTGLLFSKSSSLQVERNNLASRLDRITHNTDVFAWLNAREPQVNISIRSDDPKITAADAKSQLVVFTDMQCGYCKQFRKQLNDEIIPGFDGKLEVVFKHFPLCPDCNDGSRNLHPTACEAAYLAEAARKLGGNESFLRVTELIEGAPNRTTPWTDSEIQTLAKTAELDAEKLVAGFHSQTVRSRVSEDAQLARSLGITSSPALFLDGRRIDNMVRDFPAFWTLAANHLNDGGIGQGTAVRIAANYGPNSGSTVKAEATGLSSAPETEQAPQRASMKRLSSIEVGAPLEFTGPTVDGNEFDMKQYLGKVVIVDIWASWCGYCVEETPYLQRLYDLYHEQGLEIVGVSVDKTAEDLEKFVADNKLPWPQIYFDEEGKRGRDNPVSRQFSVRGYPCIAVVGRDGKVISVLPRGHKIESDITTALGLEATPIEDAEKQLADYKSRLVRAVGVTPPPLPKAELGRVIDIQGPLANGGTFDVKEYRGKPTLVVYWASWCGYCKKEMPNILDVYQRYHKDGFEVVGIGCDKTLAELQNYVAANNIPWPQLYDDRDGFRGFDNPLCWKNSVSGIPMMFLLDGDGKVVHEKPRGPILAEEVARLLGKEAPEEKIAETPVPAPPKGSTRLSDMQIARLVIERYDTSKDGILQVEEWKKMKGDPARYDANGDEIITTEEFAKFVTNLKIPDPKAQTAEAPKPEVEKTPDPETLAKMLIRRYDLDGDGMLQELEWRKIPGQVNRMDKNMDDVISEEEILSVLVQKGSSTQKK